MEKPQHEPIAYECECEQEKTHIVTFDGGDFGYYIMEYCQSCYDSDDKQFLVSVEVVA